jgi:hypothetical protein
MSGQHVDFRNRQANGHGRHETILKRAHNLCWRHLADRCAGWRSLNGRIVAGRAPLLEKRLCRLRFRWRLRAGGACEKKRARTTADNDRPPLVHPYLPVQPRAPTPSAQVLTVRLD